MFPDPTQPGTGCRCFVREITTDIYGIGSAGGSQIQGAVTLFPDCAGKPFGQFIDKPVDAGVFIGILLVWSGLNVGHDPGGHCNGKGYGGRKFSALFILWRVEFAQICGTPEKRCYP
jgi:hypothetical protein